MKLSTFISYLEKFAEKVNKAIGKPFQSEVSKILDDLKERSPVDTGMYRENWKTRPGPSGRKRGSTVIFYNDDPKFALMEFGAGISEAPWYFPHKKKPPSGKLKVSQGRVWAGGINPGHNLTVGGALAPVIDKYKNLNAWEGLSEAILRKL